MKSVIREVGLQKLVDVPGNYIEMQIRDDSEGRIGTRNTFNVKRRTLK